MTDTRRGGGEQKCAGAQRRTGTRLKVEGDVVMEDADENPKRRAQDQQQGRGENGRRSTGAQASAEEATGQWDARRIVGTASRVGQKGQQTGSSVGMWYSDGAERELLTGENGRRRRGAARRQGSDLQLSAWQEGAALKTLSLRAPCSEGLTTPGLGGRAPQCNCSGGNPASVSSAWGVQGHRPDHRYTHPPPTPPGHPVCTSTHTDCTCRRPGAAHAPPLCGCMLTSEKPVPPGVFIS